MNRAHLNPPGLPSWKETFSQVVVVPPGTGKTVYVSGQVAVDAAQNLVGRGDLPAQALRAFHNLETALAAAGARPSDVVKLNVYVVDYEPARASEIGDALRAVFGRENLPASTWLGVASLAKEGFLIEVDAVAVVEHA